MTVEKDIIYDTSHPDFCTFDAYIPEKSSDKLFVYFHEGGFEKGDKSDFRIAGERLANVGITAVSANYRMLPKYSYPDYLWDSALAVYKSTVRFPEATKLFIGGSSAGGYIAMMFAFDPKYLRRYDIDPLDVSGYIFDDGQPTTHTSVLRANGLDPRCIRVDDTAPLYYIDKDFPADRRLPRILFQLTEHDIYNRSEQNELMFRTLLHFGYPENRISRNLLLGHSHCDYFSDPLFGTSYERFINAD